MTRSVLSGLEDVAEYVFEDFGHKEKEEDADNEVEEEEDKDDEDEEVPEWGKSKARDYLLSLCMRPDFPSKDDIKPKQVWEELPWRVKDVPEFRFFQDYKNFATRLRQARARAEKKTGRANEDAAFLRHDREIYPERTEDFNGEPIWQGSKAQELLRRDLKDKEKMQLRPKQLQLQEEEYMEFALKNFRNRIYSERKAMQRIVYIKKKRAEKEAKQKRKK